MSMRTLCSLARMKSAALTPRKAQTDGRDMGRGRLDAFSYAVFAVIVTIMVLEIKVPHGDTLEDLMRLFPAFFSYALSFIYIGIYWNNHHHLLHICTTV